MDRIKLITVRSFALLSGLTIILLNQSQALSQNLSPEERVDQVFSHIDKPDSPGCAVSIMRKGGMVYRRGYGMSNLEHNVPITPSTVFHIASTSKQFTALAVGLLVAEGKLSWDDNVRKYVPEVPDFGKPITLRHLLYHTSGLRDHYELLIMAGWRLWEDVMRQQDVLNIISQQKSLNFQPGEKHLYSNTGYALLAVVVERVGGQSFRKFTEERIFKPLGMTQTHFNDDQQDIVKNRAQAYAPASGGGYRILMPDYETVGATNLLTTVEDLARWDRNFYTGQVGGKRLLEEMLSQGVLNNSKKIPYAHGLIVGTYRGVRKVSHGGADAGFRSNFLRFPDQEFSVAVLCNHPGSDPSKLALEIADIYLADAFTQPEDAGGDNTKSSSEADMRKWTGYYLSSEGGMPMPVKLREGALYMGVGGGQKLIHLEGNRFKVGDSNTTVSFNDAETKEKAKAHVKEEFFETTLIKADPAITTPEALKEFVGDYHSNELGVDYSVGFENGALYFWNRKRGRSPLTPAYRDGFSFYFDLMFATFTRDAQGQVDGLLMSSPRAQNVRFRKISQRKEL